MDPKISQSLVMISEVTPKDMHRNQSVDLIMVKCLWQAFLVSRRASESHADSRLEYLFWRIWSSEGLLDEMKIGRLNDLVSRIILPTSHARQSPTKHVEVPQLRAHPHYHPHPPSTSTGSSPYPASQLEAKSQPTKAKAMPQPILKKSSVPQGESNKTTRLLLEQPDGGSITRNPSYSESPTASLQEAQPKDNAAGRLAPKKSQFAAGMRSGRRRPVFNRRKSSQVSVTKPAAGPATASEQSQTQQQPPQQQKGPTNLRPPVDPLACVGSFELVFDPDYVPPVETTPPPTTPCRTKEEIEFAKIKEALADIGGIEIPKLSRKTPTTTATETTVATTPDVSDQTDTLLSQGLETVSHDPKDPHCQTGYNKEQHAESQDPTRSTDVPEIPGSTPVPGLPGLRRIPMPENMKETLLSIFNDITPLHGQISLPTRPWWTFEHAWSPVPRKEYLKDWMLTSEEWDKQPKATPLTYPGFRGRFAEAVVAARAEEEAAIDLLNDGRVSGDSRRSSLADIDAGGDQSGCVSVITHLVDNESQENRLTREEELEFERSEEQPDQQEGQVFWRGEGGDYIAKERSPLAIAVEEGAHEVIVI